MKGRSAYKVRFNKRGYIMSRKKVFFCILHVALFIIFEYNLPIMIVQSSIWHSLLLSIMIRNFLGKKYTRGAIWVFRVITSKLELKIIVPSNFNQEPEIKFRVTIPIS